MKRGSVVNDSLNGERESSKVLAAVYACTSERGSEEG